MIFDLQRKLPTCHLALGGSVRELPGEASLSDMRKAARRNRSAKRMDRRVGDRRGHGISPAPDTPAREDTGKRQRANDQKAPLKPVAH
jgi:hypothetical protein